MKPTENQGLGDKKRRRAKREGGGSPSPAPDASDPLPEPVDLPPVPEPKPLKPIGPAALKALREAIRSGQYPTDAHVRSGLGRLLRRPK